MDHQLDVLLTLTGGLAAALLFGFAANRLRLSPIVGYLLAGVAIGPFTPGFVAHREIAGQFAEIGVILLMFGVGLHFSVKELLAVRRLAVPGAVAQIAIATLLGAVVAHVAGWGLAAGLVYGFAISVASTVVLLRVLSDRDALHTPAGHVAIGWLLVEDLCTVLALVLLPSLVGDRSGSAGEVLAAVGTTLLKVGALVAFTFVAGRRLIPAVLRHAAQTRSRELFTLTVLVLALGIAVGSAKLFGASMALGAFLAGTVVGQSEFSSRAASEALPMRDAFAVLFFVAMGMLLDPGQIAANAGLTLATLAVILVGKPLAAFLVVVALREPARIAVTVAIALAQIGEFSFLLAGLGRTLGVLPEPATQALVVAATVSIVLNPILFRLAAPLGRRLSLRVDRAAEPEPAVPLERGERAIVVGHGPIGRSLVTHLREHGIEPTVIDLNHETVARLREAGVAAVYGDASQREILEHARIRDVGSLFFTSSTSPLAVIQQARAVSPELLIVTRCAYVHEVPGLRRAGADVVVASEAEVALAMTERLLLQLGATSDQLDRARERVREAFGAH